MIPSCCGIALAWFLMSRWVEALRVQAYGSARSTVISIGNITALLGAVGAALLVVASSVLESDQSAMWGLHSACASTFFVISILCQSAVTAELYFLSWQLDKQRQELPTKGNVQLSLLWVKAAINVVAFTMMIADAFVFHQGTVIDNIFEWSMVSLIITYHGTFIYDWWNVFYEESDIKTQ